MARLPTSLLAVIVLQGSLRGAVAFQSGAGIAAPKRGASVGACRGGGTCMKMEVYDSHLHVWSDGKAPYPYAPGNEPPADLQEQATAEKLLDEMDKAAVNGVLIVQPINHKFDHTYVADCIKKYPTRMKGMCLANPSLSPTDACNELERLRAQGFVGIRFNPYLWADGKKMDDEVGRALYRKAGELKMPVGFMCFKGLDKHVGDILNLVDDSPKTTAILDHFGFFKQDGKVNEEIWAKLMALSSCKQINVKLSAFFRVSTDPYPYEDLWRRVASLVSAYGSERLLYGSDFPFVMKECGYEKSAQALQVIRWGDEDSVLTEEQLTNIMGGTFKKLFGEFPKST